MKRIRPGAILGVAWIIALNVLFWGSFGAVLMGEWDLAGRFALGLLLLLFSTGGVAYMALTISSREPEIPQLSDDQIERTLTGWRDEYRWTPDE